MSQEQKENNPIYPTVIEISGTPFPARAKLLVKNSIEDMIGERIGTKFYGHSGLRESFLPSTLNVNTKLEYFEGVSRVRELFSKWSTTNDLFLIQDGVFSAIVYTEFLRRSHLFSNKEAEEHKTGLLPFLKMEDLLVINIIKPRAALTREIYPKELDLDDNHFQRKFISYSVFNESIESVLENFADELPQVVKIEPPGDEFNAVDLFFANANTVFDYLDLPNIEDWDKHLEKHPELKEIKHSTLGARSSAGLTSEEIINSLIEWDWSKQPEKRARVENMGLHIIKILEEKGLIPPK
ncbi:hypothetical protein A2159_03785 [Candidatus Woesebacteria bacterium RBG_13_34_9]|uniref:Uncharacterized protein n=1 Tax=Candidatus Woesebacteria bacterium RBG_13_34_9 TaxID=1802477 RepID=A0A1F7X0N3_9BACT|nr:MAG: hypothetical protein A2159_03785 [Candidatus Woesebacteria bacterium RBG_13_34_9]